jgi:hypothetical protein
MPVVEPTPDESAVFNLVYCSRACASLRIVDINSIVEVARRNNARHQITGWLVYSSGVFFQWLEGSKATVKALMNTIQQDQRHNTVILLSEAEETRGRLFASWDMELVAPEDIRGTLFDAISASSDSKSIAALHRLLLELDSRAIA